MSPRPVLTVDLRRLRKAAKQLLHACQTADRAALSRIIAHHPRYRGLAPSALPLQQLCLADTQLVIARELGHVSWPRLRLALRVAERHGIAPLQQRRDPVLHIRCGSDIREALRLAGLSGDFLEIADPLCQGPVAAADPAQLASIRARWMCDSWELDDANFLEERLKLEARSLAALENYRRLVLWFEHDPYDQITLIRLLTGAMTTQEYADMAGLSLDAKQMVTLGQKAGAITRAMGCAVVQKKIKQPGKAAQKKNAFPTSALQQAAQEMELSVDHQAPTQQPRRRAQPAPQPVTVSTVDPEPAPFSPVPTDDDQPPF